MPRTLVFLIALVSVTLALLAPAAFAKTVPVGTPLGDDAGVEDYQQCIITGCTLMQTDVEGHPVATVPADGTLVRFKGIGRGPVLFRVLRPALEPAGAFTAVHTSERVNLQGLTTLKTSVPVKKGDVVAVDIPNGVDPQTDVVPYTATYVGVRETAGSFYTFLEPQLPDGATAPFPTTAKIAGAIQVSADVEVPGGDTTVGGGGSGGSGATQCVVPSLKGKTLSSAKSALKKRSCTLGKVKRRSGGRGSFKVLSQTARSGTKLADGAAVGVTVARKR
jgi:hypothetical protein